MIRATDRSTGLLFDRWSHLGPKRRKLMDTSWPGVFRTYLLHKLPVERIAAHFTDYTGRPTKDLHTILGVLILQQGLDLSDADVRHAVMFNLEWHYALDITDPSDDSVYLSERTLRNYRKLVLEDGLAPLVFGTLTDELIKEFGVDTATQRLDSTHVQSNMRKLGRIRLVAAAIRQFLRAQKRSHPDAFAALSPEVLDRYLAKKSDSFFSRVKPSESAKTLVQVSRDLYLLIERFAVHDTIRKIQTYQQLERALAEQCTVTGAGDEANVTVKPPKEVPSDSLQNPSDPDAGYSAKKGQGYAVQIMETYQAGERDPKVPNLITHVDVDGAHGHDSTKLIPALDDTEQRNCCPDRLVCDTHYGSDENVCTAARKGVEVIAPVGGTPPAESITLAQFSPDLHTGYVTQCPEGHAPLHMRQTKKGRLVAAFRRKTCQGCPRRNDCPVTLEKKAAYLRYTLSALRCAVRRAREHTPEFEEDYRWRAGIEATNSHLKSDTGMGRLRVRGTQAVRLAVTFKALMLNIMRCGRAAAACFLTYFRLFPAKITAMFTQRTPLFTNTDPG